MELPNILAIIFDFSAKKAGFRRKSGNFAAMKRIIPYIYYIAPVVLSLWLLGVSGTAAVAIVVTFGLNEK